MAAKDDRAVKIARVVVSGIGAILFGLVELGVVAADASWLKIAGAVLFGGGFLPVGRHAEKRSRRKPGKIRNPNLPKAALLAILPLVALLAGCCRHSQVFSEHVQAERKAWSFVAPLLSELAANDETIDELEEEAINNNLRLWNSSIEEAERHLDLPVGGAPPEDEEARLERSALVLASSAVAGIKRAKGER